MVNLHRVVGKIARKQGILVLTVQRNRHVANAMARSRVKREAVMFGTSVRNGSKLTGIDNGLHTIVKDYPATLCGGR